MYNCVLPVDFICSPSFFSFPFFISCFSFKTLYNIHAITCHPTEMCVATGNERGEIVLWWQWSHRTKPPVMTVLHWHAHTVADLCFTSDGRYLSSPSPLFPFPFSPPLSLSLPLPLPLSLSPLSLSPLPPLSLSPLSLCSSSLSLYRYLPSLWRRGVCPGGLAVSLSTQSL